MAKKQKAEGDPVKRARKATADTMPLGEMTVVQGGVVAQGYRRIVLMFGTGHVATLMVVNLPKIETAPMRDRLVEYLKRQLEA